MNRHVHSVFTDIGCLLQECGMIFIDTRDRDVKHSLCTLFVEILVPVAAVRQSESTVS